MVSRLLAGMVVAGLVMLGPAGAATAADGPTRSALLTPDRGSELVLQQSVGRRALEMSLAPAGDVNGDGLADLLVVPDDEADGTPYVLFGRQDGATPSLTAPNGGFRIQGPASVDVGRPKALDGTPGMTAAGAGDVNADGFADLLVGVAQLDLRGRRDAGGAYVVFGGPSSEPVQLDHLGSRGFRIVGARKDDWTGRRVAAAGDVNGDGRGDLLIALDGGSVAAAVVFSPATPVELDLADPRTPALRLGFRGYADLLEGLFLAKAGDVNGDGLGDVALAGTPLSEPDLGTYGWVVFGRREPGRIRLDRLGGRGLTVSSRSVSFVDSVTGVGDFDGDGLDDVVFAETSTDSSHVVLGRRRGGRVDGRRSRANRVVPIRGEVTEMAPAGDLNGDGRADLLLSDPSASRGCRGSTGSVWVVYGRPGSGSIDLRRLGEGGFRLDGLAAGDEAGAAIAAPGDLDGDGRPDLAIHISDRLAEQGLLRRSSLALVDFRPTDLSVRLEPPQARCLTVELLTRSVKDLRRSGRARFRLRVRELVPARELGGRNPRVRVFAMLGTAPGFEIFGAPNAGVVFSNTGTRKVSVRLTRHDRRLLRRSPAPRRLTFVAFSSSNGAGISRTVRLRR